MSEEKYTRCPGCRTIFRVTPQQLALRNGQVRCGHCRTVFDGIAQLISLAPLPPRDDAGMASVVEGPPTVTLRNAQALEPAPGSVGEPTAARPAPAEAAPAAGRDDDVDYEHRFAWDRPRRLSRSRMLAYAGATALLVLLLVAQAAWHFRDAIAAHRPGLRPALASLCTLAGCEIRPLREIDALSIEASDLQANEARPGLLTLTATVRNRATYPLAYPYLELTLTDAQDQVVVRRAIVPAEYAPGANVDDGIVGNAEVAVRLFIDASATTQAGYRLYLFYP